jgi:CubicO group peptidase (beta-lactamase class C family)
MRKIIFPYIASTLICLAFFACQSGTEPVAAKAGVTGGDTSKKASGIHISYDTSGTHNTRTVQRLDSFFEKQMRVGFNGSVLIGSKGKIVYERYFGTANRAKNIDLSPESAGQLASTSKTFTGAAILYLHQQKYLNIDDPVKDYLPTFPYPTVTIKMLLDHRAGLPDYTHWGAPIVNPKVPMTNKQMLDIFAKRKFPLEFKPNSRFKYSNSNYATLALIIEAVTDLNYREFMKKYIFDPLGMKNSFVFDPAKGLPEKATISYKYNWAVEPVTFADGVYGDKGIYSTVQDMYKWDQSLYQNKFLSNETLELAYGPCSFEKAGMKNYGLGWRMLCYPNGDKVIYHNGWWHGNNTVFYRFIKDNFTIIILGNKYNSGIYHMAPPIYSIVNNVPVSKYFDTEE